MRASPSRTAHLDAAAEPELDRAGAARAALLEDGLVVSAVPASRAEEMTGAVLRVATHAWVGEDTHASVGEDDVDALVTALARRAK